MSQMFRTRVVASLTSGKWLFDGQQGFYDAFCELFDYLTQSKQTHLSFFSRGASWCQSVLGEQFPEFVEIECGVGAEAVEVYVAHIEEKYGTHLAVQPADRPFLNLSHEEEWANAKGISQEEAAYTMIYVKGGDCEE